MKNIFSRILSIALCLAICMTMAGFSAPVEPSGADNSTVILSASYSPVYGAGSSSATIIDGADLPKPSATVTSYSAAVKYARSELIKRSANISVSYVETALVDQKFVNKIIDDIYEHTGNPKEGDFLRFQIGLSVGVGYSGNNVAGSPKTVTIYVGGVSHPVNSPIGYYDSSSQAAEVDKAVAELIDELDLKNLKNDYEKISAVYYWICDNVKYDYDHLSMGSSYLLQYTAYAALVQKKAVCQGYANLFYRMMLELGIDCRIISGKANGGDHAWNIVKIGNLYYNIDSTWGSETWYSSQYFLRGSDYFPDHDRDSRYDTAAFNAAYPMSSGDYFRDDVCYHSELEYINKIPSTCIDEGYSGDLACVDCGEIIRPGEYTRPKGHSYDGTGICPDCGKPYCWDHEYAGHPERINNVHHGERCTICGYFDRNRHWAIDHDTGLCIDCGGETDFKIGDHDIYIFEDFNKKEVTCEEDGYTGDLFCSACGRILEYGEVIPNLGGHNYVDGVCTKCEQPCYHYHRDYYNPVNVKAPTCTEDGYTGDVVCLDCGMVVPYGNTIPAYGHHFGDDDVCERCKAIRPCGDINGDGKVNVQDGVLMQRILANLETDPEYIARANLNGDKKVDIQDGVKMQRILANLE